MEKENIPFECLTFQEQISYLFDSIYRMFIDDWLLEMSEKKYYGEAFHRLGYRVELLWKVVKEYRRSFFRRKAKRYKIEQLLFIVGDLALLMLYGHRRTEDARRVDVVEKTRAFFIEKLSQKNRQYGDGNLLKHGLVGILVRLDDKLARIENYLETGNIGEESMDEVFFDIAGYALNALRLLKEGRLSIGGDVL